MAADDASTRLPESFALDDATLRLRLDPRDAGFVQDPYAAYRAIHAAGGRVFWEDYGLRCFAGFAEVDALLRNRRFGRAPAAEGRAHLAWFDRVERWSLLNLEPPDHTRLRGLVNRAFVSRSIERMRPELAALCDRLIDGFEREPAVDLVARYAAPLAVRAIALLMGAPPALEPAMLRWSHAMCRLYTLAASRDDELAADAACRSFHRAIAGLVAEKRRAPATDLLGALAHGPSSEDEIVSTAVLLMNAGHEATVHQIGNAAATLLGEAPEAVPLLASPEGAAAVAEEALRHRAPLHLFTRVAAETVDRGAFAVEAGETIALLLGAANRDPAAFAEPDRFRPGRPDGAHVGFGAGLHFCLGAPLARMEIAVALQRLFARLPRLRLLTPPRFADTYHFHGLEALVAAPQG